MILLSITRILKMTRHSLLLELILQEIEGMLNYDLHLIADYFRQYLVHFNPNKTEVLLLTVKNILNPIMNFNNIPFWI